MKKISHSAWIKWLTCPKMYDLHYNEKLRPKKLSSSLIFGSAIDEGLNALLLKTGDPIKVFQDNFTEEQLRGAKFHKYDFDPEIFTTEQLRAIEGKSDDYRNWASLRIKGRLLIESYIENIYPKITKVYDVQKEIEGRPGVLDALVEIDGKKVLLDHKTSSRPYKKNAVHSSTQLALYACAEGIEYIGFAVLVKNIEKNRVKTCKKCTAKTFTQHKTCAKIVNGERCYGQFEVTTDPEGVVQLMIERVEENTKKIVRESMEDVETAIHNNIFPRNLGACGKMYGEPCIYLDYCWNNKKNGLEKKK